MIVSVTYYFTYLLIKNGVIFHKDTAIAVIINNGTSYILSIHSIPAQAAIRDIPIAKNNIDFFIVLVVKYVMKKMTY